MKMIIQTLPIPEKASLKLENKVTIRPATRPGMKYRIEWLPGKSFSVTKRWGRGKRDATTVTIDDVVSFFACPFIKAVESILGDDMTPEDREVVEHGKSARADNLWDDMPEVLRYWRAEIVLMERMALKFREVMLDRMST